MKIAFEIHTYAPELNRVYFNGHEWKNHTVDKYRLSIAASYASRVRLVRRALRRRQKATHLEVVLPNGKSLMMENTAGTVRALLRCGYNIRELRTGKRVDMFNGGVEVYG